MMQPPLGVAAGQQQHHWQGHMPMFPEGPQHAASNSVRPPSPAVVQQQQQQQQQWTGYGAPIKGPVRQ
jgi:hypothetical protein